MRKFLIVVFILIALLVSAILIGRTYILKGLKSLIIQKVEESGHAIEIRSLTYTPNNGIGLGGVTLYKDTSKNEKILYVPRAYVKLPMIKLITQRVASPSIYLYNINIQNVILSGSFGFTIRLNGNIKTLEGVLSSLKEVWVSDLAVKNQYIGTGSVSGLIDISNDSITTSNATFTINGIPSRLSLRINNPSGNLSCNINVESDNIKLTLNASKENDIYKISEIKGSFFNSSINLTGEIGGKNASSISLYGKATTDLKDVINFAQGDLKETIDSSKPEGTINSTVYFNGNLKDFSSYELGIKSNATYIKIQKFIINNVYMDLRGSNGLFTIPAISASVYKGSFAAQAKIDTRNKALPYSFSSELKGFDISDFINKSNFDVKNIRGLVSSRLDIKGDGTDSKTVIGSGKIIISNANLGPMPLFSPLVGNIYGFIQYKLPEVKRVDITDGSCDLYIKNRKISTDNLILFSKVMSINAKGYMDFDTNLDFEVSNELLEPEGGAKEESDWQRSLQDLMMGVGKMISKAYLTGTLKNPQWKFEYLGGLKGAVGGDLGKMLKGLFE